MQNKTDQGGLYFRKRVKKTPKNPSKSQIGKIIAETIMGYQVTRIK